MSGRLPELVRDPRGPLVYVLDCDHGVKIGVTILTLRERLADLSRSSGITNPAVVRVWLFDTRRDALTVERAAHWLLRDTRTVGEWFHCHPLEACDAVEAAIRKRVPLPVLLLGHEEEAA